MKLAWSSIPEEALVKHAEEMLEGPIGPNFYIVVQLFNTNTGQQVGMSGSCGTDARSLEDLKNCASIAAEQLEVQE